MAQFWCVLASKTQAQARLGTLGTPMAQFSAVMQKMAHTQTRSKMNDDDE
jgi:hypothetical protein